MIKVYALKNKNLSIHFVSFVSDESLMHKGLFTTTDAEGFLLTLISPRHN